MSRQEFLKMLEEALAGKVSSQVLQSNLQYYKDYIFEEMRKGRSEREILEELGDPRLIARSILDAQGVSGETFTTEPTSRYDYDDREESYSSHGRVFHVGKIGTTIAIAAIVIVLLVVISLIFKFTFAILFSPVFWTILAGWMIWRIITK